MRLLAILLALLLILPVAPASAEVIFRTVTIAWDPSPTPGIVGYRLRYGTTRGDYSRVIETGALSADIPNVIDGTTYFFLISAYNELGEESAAAEFVHTAGEAMFLNISTRAYVRDGDDVMIAGFIIGGSSRKRVMVRVLGPSLADYGLSRPLYNPAVELHGPGGLIADNDNWREGWGAGAEAFGFAPLRDAEAAIVVDLPPGTYTAIVYSADRQAGTALLEVYDGGVPQ